MTMPRIVPIPILPFGMVNAHLIHDADGCILVDAGLPGTEHKIEKVLVKHGISFKDIKLIVVTHAHVDHAGNAYALRELSGAPIVAHADDVKYYKQESQMTFLPTGWFGRLFLKTKLVYQPYKRFVPDILLSKEESLDLNRFGIPGTVKHTPGHTAGQLSFKMGSLLFSGDNIYKDSCVGVIDAHHGSNIPDFITSLKRIVADDSQFLLPSHGPVFRRDNRIIQKAIDRLTQYQHMADFGTCAVDWPLLDEWEADVIAGRMPFRE